MSPESIAHPPISDRATWQQARAELLIVEKALTRERDRVNAIRRRLPMVQLPAYEFDGPDGSVSFVELFAGKRQLVIYHFMYGPDWDAGCPVCTAHMKAMGGLDALAERDTTFALVARAPIHKINAHKATSGIRFPFYSSFRSSFNFDMDMSSADGGEGQGMSVFFQMNGNVYHTYTTQQRGVEGITNVDSFLDITPYGRQQDFEDSPPGWPQRPTYE